MEDPGSAAIALATVGALGIVVKAIVDAVKRAVPALTGTGIQLVAVAIGILIAGLFDLQATAALLEASGAHVGRIPHYAVDWVITGIAIAAAAGFFHGREPEPAPVIEVDATGSPVL